jgi:GTP-binding protein
VQLFSALKRTGLEEAHELIESWIGPDAVDDSAGDSTSEA